MAIYAVGLMVELNGKQDVVVDAIEAASSAEALGKMILNSGYKTILSFNIRCNDMDFVVRQMVSEGNKIGAIKMVRETLGGGLKEAKDYVDRLI